VAAIATFFDRAAGEPEGIGLVGDGCTLTWRELVEHIVGRAVTLVEHKLGPSPRLAVIGENSPETLITYAAAALAGIGTVLVNHQWSPAEITYVLRDSRATAAWATERMAAKVMLATQETGVRLLPAGFGCDTYDGGAGGMEPWNSIQPTTDLIYTSGTTGFPKGVAVPVPPPASVGDRLQQMARHHCAGLGPHLVAGPLYHAGPHAAVGLLLTGTPVIVPGRFDPEVALTAIERHSVASSIMVPTHFSRLLALPVERRAAADVSSLRLVAHTGSACPIALKSAMIGWFGPVFRESYGASESGIISYISTKEWERRPGSVGLVKEPFEALVIDQTGAPCPPGQDGQLYFIDHSGRGILYHNDPAKTEAAHRGPGVFTLGDMGHLDADGYLFVTGRTTDMIISGGVNIYPAECERVLRDHPGVGDAALFGVPDPDMGERLVGAITFKEAPLELALLTGYCRERLAHYKVPKEWWVLADIPRTEMGKLDKQTLRDHYGRRER
jgi:long-chain acyl-CoA synthetase